MPGWPGRVRQTGPRPRRIARQAAPSGTRRGRHPGDQDGHVVTQVVLGEAGEQVLDHPGGLGRGPAGRAGQLVGQPVFEVLHVGAARVGDPVG